VTDNCVEENELMVKEDGLAGEERDVLKPWTGDGDRHSRTCEHHPVTSRRFMKQLTNHSTGNGSRKRRASDVWEVQVTNYHGREILS
jgi:hypothetical protein